MAKIVRLTQKQLRKIISEAVSSRMKPLVVTRQMLRGLIKEVTGTSTHDWDYFVESVADLLSQNIDIDAWEIADTVFHPSPDKTVRAMRDDVGSLPQAVIDAQAAKYNLDPDDLRSAFEEALGMSEEYMPDKEDDEEETVYDRAEPLVSGQGVTLNSLGPDVVQQYMKWQQTSPDARTRGYNYGPDEPVFFVDPIDGLIVGYDVKESNYFAMRMPGLEEFLDFDGDEIMPWVEP